ncbi:MAG: winged helix-turn-helix transcriptional regulator [Oligoflexia bacterium]|nr:winged helix-turn-helix transcriptional regulator [Oligoflexia bacterium]
MLDKILGSEIAMKIMLHLAHYREVYPTAVAKDYDISLSGVQKQFSRFEEAGILVSKLVGRTRVYFFNEKSLVAKKFIEFIKVYYDGLSLEDKERIFSSRRRPRRSGKPVIKKKE